MNESIKNILSHSVYAYLSFSLRNIPMLDSIMSFALIIHFISSLRVEELTSREPVCHVLCLTDTTNAKAESFSSINTSGVKRMKG